MTLSTLLADWFRIPNRPQLVAWIDPSHVTPRVTATPIAADASYVRVTLVEMVLARSRNWFVDYQPMVSGVIGLRFGDHDVQLPAVAAADAKRFAPGVSVLQNYRLLDLVPFRGGSLSLDVALLAQPGKDLIANAIRGLTGIAALVGPPLTQAMEVAKRVKDSVELFGGAGTEIQLAYHNLFSANAGANQIHDGYLAVVRSDQQPLAGALVVDNDQLRVWDGQTAALPLDRDYLLFRFEVLPSRDDLRAFSDLEKLRADALSAFIGNQPDADHAMRAALRAIVLHPELVNADRRTLAAELKAECDAYRQAGHGAQPMPEPRAWSELCADLPRGIDGSPVTLDEFMDSRD